MYKGKNSIILTARSMDWKEDIRTDLWIFPRGMERDGATGDDSLKWTSKYGSVIASAYNIATADGMNEKGLFEYVGGKLVIHHDLSYQVMTNSPIFEQQLALNSYWKEIGGTVMLPGTNRASDRFVRASFYTHAVPITDDIRVATAAAFSIIRTVQFLMVYLPQDNLIYRLPFGERLPISVICCITMSLL